MQRAVVDVILVYSISDQIFMLQIAAQYAASYQSMKVWGKKRAN